MDKMTAFVDNFPVHGLGWKMTLRASKPFPPGPEENESVRFTTVQDLAEFLIEKGWKVYTKSEELGWAETIVNDGKMVQLVP